jgi:hypothetical protein
MLTLFPLSSLLKLLQLLAIPYAGFLVSFEATFDGRIGLVTDVTFDFDARDRCQIEDPTPSPLGTKSQS